MKTMDIIFNYDDYSDEFVNDLTIWCEEHSVPTSKIIIGMKEDNADGIDYYVITLNETLFSYLMMREFNIFEQYGSEGWNRYIQSEYHCEIV